jgi:predicted DCC family thiol-disulfide oxidoreductase YuxK
MGDVVVFDGVCNLCNTVVQTIIRGDPDGRFQFASLQSEGGRHLLEQHGVNALEPETVVLIRDGRVFTMSDAVLEIVRHMRFPYPLLLVGYVLPRFIRDALYRVVARNRYRWFGRRDSCMMPTPDLRHRFLD